MHVLLALGGLEQNVHELAVPFLHLRPLQRIETQLPSDEDIENLVIGTLSVIVENTELIVLMGSAVHVSERQTIVFQQLSPLLELLHAFDRQQGIVSLLELLVIETFWVLVVEFQDFDELHSEQVHPRHVKCFHSSV